jgi:phage-related minor tail protein
MFKLHKQLIRENMKFLRNCEKAQLTDMKNSWQELMDAYRTYYGAL